MSKKTKEDMLQNMGISFGMHQDNSLEDILTSMDEYAKQEAIGFAGWINEKCNAAPDTEDKYNIIDWFPYEQEFSIPQLHELYQKSKQQ